MVIRGRLLAVVLGLLVMGALAAMNELIFRRVLGSDYFIWFLENGALISIGFTVLSLAWGDTNDLRGLVSADPSEFLEDGALFLANAFGGWVAIFGPSDRPRLQERLGREDVRQMAAVIRQWQETGYVKKSEFEAARYVLGAARRTGAGHALKYIILRVVYGGPDYLLAFVLFVVFFVVALGWLLIVAPLQYGVHLIVGAPARLMIHSEARAWRHRTEGGLELIEGSRDDAAPKGAVEAGFSSKPVTLTTSLSALVLWVLSRILL